MATEPQRSEIMSGAPSSSEFAFHTPVQTDVSADAALIMAALGRMEAVIRDQRAAFDRLRAMLGEMAEAIAKAKAVADAETSANLLDELEHHVDAMMEIGRPGAATAPTAAPDPQPSSPAAQIPHEDVPLADGAGGLQHAGVTAPDAAALASAIRHPAEDDQVPTVSDVVFRLDPDDGAPAAADIPPVDTAASAPTVAMLTAMVEALRDSIVAAAPDHKTALEAPASDVAEVVAPSTNVAPQFETPSIEIALPATPTTEIARPAEAADVAAQEMSQATGQETPQETAQETAHLIEEPQAGEATEGVAATHTIEAAEAAVIAPQDLAPEDLAPQDLAPHFETPSVEIAEVATPTPEIAQAVETTQETAHLTEPPQAGETAQAMEAAHAIEAAETAEITPPADAEPDQGPSIAMLTALLEVPSASVAALESEPAIEAALPASQADEAVAQPLDTASQNLASDPETRSIEIAEVTTPTVEIAQLTEAAHPVETAHAEVPQAVVTHTIEAPGPADNPPPAAKVPDNSAFLAMLHARMEVLRAAAATPVPEPEAALGNTESVPETADAVAQPLDIAPQNLAPDSETPSIEIAEAATPTAENGEAAEVVQETALETVQEAAQQIAHVIEAPQAEAPRVEATHDAIDDVAAAADIPPAADAVDDKGPTVATLSARMEALRAAVAASAPEPEAPIESPQAASQVAGAAHAVEPPHSGEVQTAEAMQAVELAADPPAPRASITGAHESALLASLEQMGARPFPPPDVGTAVIFAPKPEFEFLPEFAREPTAPSDTAPSGTGPSETTLPETAPEPDQPAAIDHTATEHAAIEPTAAEPTTVETPIAEIAPEVAHTLAAEPALSATEVATTHIEPAMHVEPTPETLESDFDPADFLFEPEPDPAAFLLEPTPPTPRAPAVVLPRPEFIAPASKPEAAIPETSQPVEPEKPTPEPAPRDPLHALKAMSENEKIALFS